MDRPSHTHIHKMDPYKGASSSLKDPFYVMQTNRTGTNQATPMYIRWTLIKNYIPYTKGPPYVNSLQANQKHGVMVLSLYLTS